MEALLHIAGLVSIQAVVDLGRRYTSAGSADRVSLQAVGDALLNLRTEAGLIGVMAFSLGALMYYYLFYRPRLIPRWLSGWGIVAIVFMMLADLLAWFNHNPVTSYVILAAPIGVQEMVLAVWLIARGFSLSALPAGAPWRVSTAVARAPR